MKENDENIAPEELDSETNFLVSQILNASDREVLDNVRRMYGDENKLADETREIFCRVLTTHRINKNKTTFFKKISAQIMSMLLWISGFSPWKAASIGLTRFSKHIPLLTRRQIGLAVTLSAVSVGIVLVSLKESFLGSQWIVNVTSKVSKNKFATLPCYKEAANAPSDKIVDAYRACAEQGDALAQYQLGRLYAKGIAGQREDDREAALWYKRAAAQGYSYAQVALASFYENSRGGLPKDDREAARLYSLAAAQGNPFAQMALASFYENGRGGLPTDKIYAESLRKAASDAHAVAMVPGQRDLGF
jgi:hypothetical protein